MVIKANVKKLFKALNVVEASEPSVFSSWGMTHQLVQKAEGATDILIGVQVSKIKATEAAMGMKAFIGVLRPGMRFNKLFDKQIAQPKGLGEEFEGYVLEDGRKRFQFSRGNVNVGFTWRGELQDAVIFGRKLDNLIQTSEEIFPTGQRLTLPKIEISNPKRVALRSEFQATYKTEKAIKVRATVHADYRSWSSQGRFKFYAGKIGAQWDTILFINSDHVVFEKRVEYLIVNKT